MQYQMNNHQKRQLNNTYLMMKPQGMMYNDSEIS